MNNEFCFKFIYCFNDDNVYIPNIIDHFEHIIKTLDIYCSNYTIDNENILKADLILSKLEDLVKLSAELDDDIIITGTECNMLMTKDTMKQLGLF